MTRDSHPGEGDRGREAHRLRDALFRAGDKTGAGHADEALRAELGERAMKGLSSENGVTWGKSNAAAAVSRRAGEEKGALKDVEGRTRW